jgi:regulator of protease activity HflC (stomatin/prohibitin superfamily)
VKGPGLIILIPIVDCMVKMDLRVVTIEVAKQEIMTHDNVPATVDAVVYFRVVDPTSAVVKVENFLKGYVADRSNNAAKCARPGSTG